MPQSRSEPSRTRSVRAQMVSSQTSAQRTKDARDWLTADERFIRLKMIAAEGPTAPTTHELRLVSRPLVLPPKQYSSPQTPDRPGPLMRTRRIWDPADGAATAASVTASAPVHIRSVRESLLSPVFGLKARPIFIWPPDVKGFGDRNSDHRKLADGQFSSTPLSAEEFDDKVLRKVPYFDTTASRGHSRSLDVPQNNLPPRSQGLSIVASEFDVAAPLPNKYVICDICMFRCPAQNKPVGWL